MGLKSYGSGSGTLTLASSFEIQIIVCLFRVAAGQDLVLVGVGVRDLLAGGDVGVRLGEGVGILG